MRLGFGGLVSTQGSFQNQIQAFPADVSEVLKRYGSCAQLLQRMAFSSNPFLSTIDAMSSCQCRCNAAMIIHTLPVVAEYMRTSVGHTCGRWVSTVLSTVLSYTLLYR
jgi:hypothetical protein